MKTMYRTINYSGEDYYCRYLAVDLTNGAGNRIAGGRFGTFMQKNFQINKLPYKISLQELIEEKIIKPELLIKIPDDVFSTWENYPFLPVNIPEQYDLLRFYDLEIIPELSNDLRDYMHPYDYSCKGFKDKYAINAPQQFSQVETINNKKAYPYYAYLSYWHAFVIYDTYEICKNIDKFLDEEKGLPIFKKTLKRLYQHYEKNYKEVFERLAHYKTIISQINSLNSTLEVTYSTIARKALEFSNSQQEDLSDGLGKLLTLHSDFKRRYNNSEGLITRKALEYLTRDIYFLFEWLVYSGISAEKLFSDWEYSSRSPHEWSQLKEAINFEEILIEQSFKNDANYYLSKVDEKWDKSKILDFYKQVTQFDGYEPWLRPFYDLHNKLKPVKTIRFQQDRIIDFLIIFTIRTEIILRSLSYKVIGKSENDLKKILSELAKNKEISIHNKQILEAASTNYKHTKLHDKPELICQRIKDIEIGKKWSKSQIVSFRNILKFITYRNYFAHHSYKDKELNQASDLAGEVLSSCLYTIFYMTKTFSPITQVKIYCERK